MATDKSRWGIIYSSRAGSLKSHKRWQLIRRYMESHGIKYDFVQSEGFGSVERLSGMLCSNGYSTIVLVGGDGTLNDAINGILHCETIPENFALGIIPNGIGNDFSRFWGMTVENYKKSIDNIIARKTRKIDVGYCCYTDENNVQQKRYFVNCINIGLGARLVKMADEAMRLIGSKQLSMIPVAIAQAFERKSFNAKLKADTEEISQEVMSICIGNCLGYGQTPNSVPYNGMLDMSIITRPKWWQLLEGFWLLGKGRFLNYKNVHPYRIKRIEIEDVDKALISLDGRILQNSQNCPPLKIGIECEKLDFIINF